MTDASDLVERLTHRLGVLTVTVGPGLYDDIRDAATTLPAKDKEIEALRKDRDFWKSERDRIRAFLSEGDCLMLESEQAWKARAETAERRVAELEDEIKGLNEEADLLADMHVTAERKRDEARRCAIKAEEECDELVHALDEARAALKAFGSAADGLPPSMPDEFELLLKFDATPFAAVKAGDFRAARAVINKGE